MNSESKPSAETKSSKPRAETKSAGKTSASKQASEKAQRGEPLSAKTTQQRSPKQENL
jgi:hypothetical protein